MKYVKLFFVRVLKSIKVTAFCFCTAALSKDLPSLNLRCHSICDNGHRLVLRTRVKLRLSDTASEIIVRKCGTLIWQTFYLQVPVETTRVLILNINVDGDNVHEHEEYSCLPVQCPWIQRNSCSAKKWQPRTRDDEGGLLKNLSASFFNS